jgi:acetolactate synthase I/II/III large subunit
MATRRDFLKGVAAIGAASSLPARVGAGPSGTETDTGRATVSAAPPSRYEAVMELETPDEEGYTEAEATRYFVEHPASDFMVDVIKKLGIEYVASNPGSSFRGLQESIVTYGGNTRPEFLTCLHEESAVAMGHGYAKIAYKPMAVACHGTVGLQHAAMAVYNAYCDRAPVIILAGNHVEASGRRPGAEWSHSALDCAKLVRDFTKWDDIPLSLTHFVESVVRAYRIAMTPPMGPVVIVLDGHLQEEEIKGAVPPIPPLTAVIPPHGDTGALREAARLLVAAQNPVILPGRVARTAAGMERLVELAEALQAPVVGTGGRMNFPNDHPLSQSGGRLIREADVILGLELEDFWNSVHDMRDLPHREAVRVAREDVKLISLGVGDLALKANYQNFQRFQPVDLSISGDAEATLPFLTEEVRRLTPADGRSRLAERAERFRVAHGQAREQARRDAAHGWNSSPVSMARVSLELWHQIKARDWSLVAGNVAVSGLWTINRHYHRIGGSGGAGVGYAAPASVGAALANRALGRFSVAIQPDGDLMYAPGVLWTAAHHNIPLLSVVHNNRAYHQEVMHLQRMALRRQRGADGLAARVGNTFQDPFIDYATLAKGLGVWSEGPITNPGDLGPALRRAIDVVDRGEPALLDVVCQPR